MPQLISTSWIVLGVLALLLTLVQNTASAAVRESATLFIATLTWWGLLALMSVVTAGWWGYQTWFA